MDITSPMHSLSFRVLSALIAESWSLLFLTSSILFTLTIPGRVYKSNTIAFWFSDRGLIRAIHSCSSSLGALSHLIRHLISGWSDGFTLITKPKKVSLRQFFRRCACPSLNKYSTQTSPTFQCEIRLVLVSSLQTFPTRFKVMSIEDQ
jgi:hypothetical protein